MTPAEFFTEHDLKIRELYLSWQKNLKIGCRPFPLPGAIVEQMLKALIARYKGYSKFGYDERDELNQVIRKHGKAEIGVKSCIDVIKQWHKDGIVTLVDETVLTDMNTINPDRNAFMHTTTRDRDLNGIQAEDVTDRLMEWFFKEKVQDLKWRVEITAELQNFERQYLTRVHDSSTEIVALTKEYWSDKYNYAIEIRDEIYENIFLRTDESYTHSFVALEAMENSQFCDALTDQSFKVTQFGQDENLVFEELLQHSLNSSKRSLINIFAPSGEGKSVLLSKIGYYYAQKSHIDCGVYYLSNINVQVIEELRSILEAAVIPIIILIDTPSQYDVDLTASWNNLRYVKCATSFVVITTDQRLRYQKRLLNSKRKDFESPFSEVHNFEFFLDIQERDAQFEKVRMTLVNKGISFSDDLIKNTFFTRKDLTIRERIRSIVRACNIRGSALHVDDWEIYNEITIGTFFDKFNVLFPLTAIFSFFEVGVPLELFDNYYFDGIESFSVHAFLNTDSRNVIRISQDRKLVLRHEEVAKWYFEDKDHRELATTLVEKFLRRFSEKNDLAGCYLFRNAHSQIQKSFLSPVLPPERRQMILENFVAKTEYNETTKVDIGKVRIALSKLETILEKKISWLDPIIDLNSEDVHARTLKIGLLIQQGEEGVEEAESLLDDLKTKGCYDSYVFSLEKSLRKIQGRVLPLAELLSGRGDRDTILREIASERARKGRIDEVMTIFQDVGYDINDPVSQMIAARFHINLGDDKRAIELLEQIVQRDSKDIPAALLLSEIHCRNEQWSKAESTLVRALFNEPSRIVAVKVTLAKLYRNEYYIDQDESGTYEKAALLFSDKHRSDSLMRSEQYRTEYAKWCYERHPHDKSYHQIAVDVLWGTINEINEAHFYSYLGLGTIYQESEFFKDLKKAQHVLERGLEKVPSHESVSLKVALATAYMKIGTQETWHKALELLQKTIGSDQANGSAELALLKVYHYFGENKKELELAREIASNRRIHLGAIIHISEDYLTRGLVDLAIECIVACMEVHPKNYKLLNQAGKLLLTKRNPSRYDTRSQSTNNILVKRAIDYLIESKEINANSLHTRTLLISAYDSFSIDQNSEVSLYNEIVSKRNKEIQEFYALAPGNIFLMLTLSKIFIKSNNRRLAIRLLDSLDFTALKDEDKIKIVTQKKAALVAFNDIHHISLMDSIVDEIESNNIHISRKVRQDFRKVHFAQRYNYCLLEKYNVGTVNLDGISVLDHDSGKSYPISGKFTLQNKVKTGGKIYFATYLVSNRIKINNIEPFFDESTFQPDIESALPEMLNMINV